MSPHSVLRKALVLPGLRSSLLLILAGVLLLLLVVGATVGVRPEIWAGGPELVLLAALASLGTSAAALVPVVAAGVAFVTARGLHSGWEALGLGRLRLWAALWPVWTLLLVLSLLLSFVAEPAGWRLVHRVKGTPLAASASWHRLAEGQALTLADGGWARRQGEGGFDLRTADGSVALRASSLMPRHGEGVWELTGVALELSSKQGDGSWTMESLRVLMDGEAAERYHAPPSSPWARSMGELWSSRRDDPRSARVWGRRWIQVLGVPLLALAVWLLVLAPAPRARRPELAVGASIGLILSFFVLIRIGESLPSPLLGALLPLVSLGLVVLLRLQR